MQQSKEQWIRGAAFLLIGILYFVIKFQYHELWKDEWQPWLLARDKSLSDLLSFLHNEGHPALWFCYLKPWAMLSEAIGLDPSAQVNLFSIAHSIPFLASLFIVLFRFKIPLTLSLGLIVSFFFFYEYGIVNRGYILLIFLSFWLVSLLKEKGKTTALVTALLFLICQTEVYGVFVAAALFCCFWFDYYKRENSITFWKEKRMLWNGLSLFAGIAVFVLTVFPRGGQKVIGLNTDAALINNLGHAFQGNLTNTFLIGLIPDTNVFGVSVLGLLGGALLLALLTWFFYRDKGLLFSFIVYLLAVLAFGAYIYQGGVRHWGINFIFLIVLIEYYIRRNGALSSWQFTMLASFLLFQFYYSFLAVQKELKHPFSNAKKTAEFILEKIPDNVPIVAINQFETAPVVAYSGRVVHALPEGEPFTYYHWLDKVYLPSEQELKLFTEYKKKSGVVILSPKPLGRERYPNAQLWQAFDSFNLKNENYFVYLLSLKGK